MNITITNRITHDCQQGSPEWHALRAKHFTASEAPAMLGVSKHQTRADLLKRSTEASQAIRKATASLQLAQAQNIKDFRHELQSTATDRAGCVFPAGVMRSISAARDRAATAAAHGIVDTVPTATGGPTDDR